MERYASIKRATKETDITAVLSLDGAGNGKIASGIGFLTICSRALPDMDFLT